MCYSQYMRRWGQGTAVPITVWLLIGSVPSFIYSCKAITSRVLKQRDMTHADIMSDAVQILGHLCGMDVE